MTTTYQLPMFARLWPRTPWNGGMLAGSDVLTLADAARFASKHAGAEITPADFLRAAARGQIPMRAICRRTVTLAPCRETDEPLPMPEDAIPTLPLDACKALSSTGRANWRTVDGHEEIGALGGLLLGRFTRWQLPENEPDLVTTSDDCRLLGWDVHALADSYLDSPDKAQQPAAPVADALPSGATWTVSQPKRYSGYSLPLYRLLCAANREGKPRPRAREVLEEWRVNRPAEIEKVLPDGIDYFNNKGDPKSADLEAIRKAIGRMTSAR